MYALAVTCTSVCGCGHCCYLLLAAADGTPSASCTFCFFGELMLLLSCLLMLIQGIQGILLDPHHDGIEGNVASPTLHVLHHCQNAKTIQVGEISL